MDGMEEKLGSILSNPDLMSQIMTMAQSLSQQNQSGQEPPQKSQAPKPTPPPAKPTPQPAKGAPTFGKNEIEMIRKLSSFSQQAGLDRQQQALLKALNPYLSHDRIGKLEKAMHAAKLAKFASSALEQSGGQLKLGR